MRHTQIADFEFKNTGLSGGYESWECDISHFIDVWEEAKKHLSKSIYTLDGKSIDIETDWSKIVEGYKNFRANELALEKILRLSEPPNIDEWIKLEDLPSEPCKILITVTADDGITLKNNAPINYVSSYLFDIFLILNIALPGSCNFWGSKLKIATPSDMPFYLSKNFSLSNDIFPNSKIYKSLQLLRMPRRLALDDVLRWYFLHRNSMSQIPKSNIQMVLFAIMHIANSNFSHMTIIWIYNALEILFGIPRRRGGALIRERAAKLLNITSDEYGCFDKSVQKFLKTRHKIAHRGMEIIHPLSNDILDPDVLTVKRELEDNIHIGFNLLLVSLQTVVEHGWKEIAFSEEVIIEGLAF